MNPLQNCFKCFSRKHPLIHHGNGTCLVRSMTIPHGIYNSLNRTVGFDILAVLTNGMEDVVISSLRIHVFEAFRHLTQRGGSRLRYYRLSGSLNDPQSLVAGRVSVCCTEFARLIGVFRRVDALTRQHLSVNPSYLLSPLTTAITFLTTLLAERVIVLVFHTVSRGVRFRVAVHG
jgi:hypothetical protein